MSRQDTFQNIQRSEEGLRKALTTRQMSMIAIGGAIGTGLFLGSGPAIGLAGPSVIVSYAVGALVALLLMGCLAEMTVAHPTSGSFGAFAQHYVGPWAGFATRYAYWAANVAAVGTEVTAIAVYMRFWFPEAPGLLWIFVFSGAVILIHLTGVGVFGAAEYGMSFIKVAAIVAFILFGSYVLFGANTNPDIGFSNYTSEGGFFPNGVWGMWTAVFIALFSYLSIEVVAITAGEAREPEVAVPKALRWTVFRLIVFYLLTLILTLAIVPWTEASAGESPFVRVLQILDFPAGAGVMNFVVLVAALSAMNTQLYGATRTIFSLSRNGFAPRAFGSVGPRGIPVAALLTSSLGIALAAVVNALRPEAAFIILLGVASFGAFFTWFMIFVTHLFFRREWDRSGVRRLPVRMVGYPYLTALGALLMAAVLLSSAFSPDFRITLIAGVPFLLLVSIAYFAGRSRFSRTEKPDD